MYSSCSAVVSFPWLVASSMISERCWSKGNGNFGLSFVSTACKISSKLLSSIGVFGEMDVVVNDIAVTDVLICIVGLPIGDCCKLCHAASVLARKILIYAQ
jgi:hypothetical protein